MKKNLSLIVLIMMFWFTISFISNILGSLIPDIINGFSLTNLALAGFIPTFFFIAYAFMSIPSGMLIDKYGNRPILFIGFALPFVGTVLFACFPSYPILLLSCFIIGVGMAMLQTVINPLQRLAAGEENYAFIAEMAQFVFGVASFSSPLLYSYLILRMESKTYAGGNVLIDMLQHITPKELPWVSMYWIFALLLFVMMVAVLTTRIPRMDRDTHSAGGTNYLELFKQTKVWLYFLGIFCYVSTEQGLTIFMSTFLEKYHGADPQVVGAQTVSLFWGSMTVGCIIGMILLKLVDSKRLLIGSGLLTAIFLLTALYSPLEISRYAFPAIGFSASLMFSIIFSLALNSAKTNHGSFAGILCSGIAGGAAGPLIVSVVADATNLRIGMLCTLVFILYITLIGVWASPLVNNKTVKLKKLFNLVGNQ